jgi:hypothetical protein
MAKRFQLQPLAQALTLCLPAGVAAFSSLQVEAAQVMTLPAVNSKLDSQGTISVTSPANTVTISAQPITIARFAPSLGVLTQVDSSITSTAFNLSLGVSGKLQASPAPASNVNGQALFFYNSIAKLNTTGSLLNISCSVVDNTGCSTSSSLANMPPAVAQTKLPATLDAYVGETGTVTIAQPNFQVLAQSDSAGNPATASASIKWQGTELTSYSYLNHAAPVFGENKLTSLTLDFGTLKLGAAEKLKWSIFGPGNSNTVGLDFDLISPNSADAARFIIGGSLFSGMAAGFGKGFDASINTSQSGSFLADYVLHLSDADVGAPSTRSNYNLNLTLKGVIAAPVPVPSAWVLMASGLGLFGWKARKQINSA